MFYLIGFISILFITNGFILLEEELLIILANFFWVYIAGSFIKNLLINELEYKSSVLRTKYVWFLKKKLKLDDSVIRSYYKRFVFLRVDMETAEYYIPKLIENNIKYYYSASILVQKYLLGLGLVSFGKTLIKEIFAQELEQVYFIIAENKNFLNKYTTLKYINTVFEEVDVEYAERELDLELLLSY